jgi:hypothetical protein
MSIPHRRAAYSTVSIPAMTDNRLHRIYAFRRSILAFGVAGEVVLEWFGGGIGCVLDFQRSLHQFFVASADG